MAGVNPIIAGRARSYVFTWFPSVSDLKESIKAWSDSVRSHLTDVRHIRYQLERAPGTNRVHVQGCISFQESKTFSAARSWFARHPGSPPHLERARNWKASLAYCAKSETSIPGSQVDLEQAGPPEVVKSEVVLTAEPTPTRCLRDGCSHAPILRLPVDDPKRVAHIDYYVSKGMRQCLEEQIPLLLTDYVCPFTGLTFP